MPGTQPVPPSVSREPIALDGTNLATICVLCSHNCGLRVDVAGGRLTKIRPDESSPISHGYVCNKAYSIGRYVEHAQRVRHPLRRQPDGSFVEATWDEAIADIASRLTTIRTAHGPRAIGLVGIGGQGNHMDAPYGLGFLRGVGSRRWFNAFAQEKTQHALVDHWMFDASPATFLHADVDRAQYLLVLGTNPKISNRGHNATDTFKMLAEDPTRTVVVVDPRETETTRTATQHLRVRPGGDVYLLAAMASVIVRHELADYEFLAAHTTGFDQVREALARVDLDTMAEYCGIDAATIVAVATDFARAESAGIFYDLGVEMTPHSTLVSYLMRLLMCVTGNLCRPGGHYFFESFLPPMVDPTRVREPERAVASGIAAIRALGNAGMFSPTLVPEEILVDHPERMRAVIVEGANPILSYSDASRWREARARLDLLVVIDPAMTETAQLADWILPPPVGYEKWEIASFPRGYPQVFMQVRPPVVPAPDDTLTEPEIYVRLAEAMGLFGPVPDELRALAAGALEPEGAMAYLMAAQQAAGGDENRMLFWTYRALGPLLSSPALAAIWLIVHINAMMRTEAVLRSLGASWAGRSPFEIGHELFRRVMAHPEGFELARANPETALRDSVNTADGRIRLAVEVMLGELARVSTTPPRHDPAYPFILAAGLRTHWTANTIHRDPMWRKGKGGLCALSLSPPDAASLGIRDGDAVRVATARGSLTLPALIDAKMQPGHLAMPNGFGGSYPDAAGVPTVAGGNANEITDVNDRDPFTGIPNHRHVACRLERVGA